MPFSVDQLEPLYREHGFNLRKHIGQFPSWPTREAVVVDLDDTERAILRDEGEEALDRHLRARGMFPVPALDIRALAPLHLETLLCADGAPAARIFTDGRSDLCDAAGAICQMLTELGAPAPPVHFADEFDLLDLAASHAIVLGGAHENSAAALLSDRGWLDADRRFPGPGGWVVRTVHNPAGLGHNILQIVADTATQERALAALRERLSGGGDCAALPPVNEVHPGPQARKWLGDFRGWQERFAEIAFRGRVYEYEHTDDVEQFAHWLSSCFNCGGPEGDIYNRGPMVAGAMAARLFRLTGDRRFLELSRHLLLTLIDYHCNFPGGASYLADYDFSVHEAILYWDLLEQEDVFSDEERLIITNFLLASVRMAEGYRQERWPVEEGRLRHNHETFPGLTAFMGGRYFSDYYDIPDAREWLDTARMIFSGPIERLSRHREDANGYQWLVPTHKLVYDAWNGEDDLRENGVLEQMVRGLIATTDNLGHPADFGDVGRPLSGGARQASLLEMIAGRVGDPGAQWWAEKLYDTLPGAGNTFIGGFLGEIQASCRMEPRQPDEPPVLDVLPLPEHIREMAAPQMPRLYVYDKAALRDGHDPEDAYLLLDGFTAGSHGHYDQNAIIRYTAAGRVWLVDNAYGKPSGVSAAGKAFSMRRLGPQDHNTLLILREDGELALPPPFCALLSAESAGPLTLLQSALAGYGGVDWLRTILWIAGTGLLVIDQANVMDDIRRLRCQLNMLGEVTVADSRLTCAQRDRWMHLSFERHTAVEVTEWSNADWDAEFASGVYPFAGGPIRKFERVVRPSAGESVLFATLIETAPSDERSLELSLDGDGLTVRGPLPEADVTLEGAGTRAHLANGALTLALTAPWPVPENLPRLPAQDERYSLRA